MSTPLPSDPFSVPLSGQQSFLSAGSLAPARHVPLQAATQGPVPAIPDAKPTLSPRCMQGTSLGPQLGIALYVSFSHPVLLLFFLLPFHPCYSPHLSVTVSCRRISIGAPPLRVSRLYRHKGSRLSCFAACSPGSRVTLCPSPL